MHALINYIFDPSDGVSSDNLCLKIDRYLNENIIGEFEIKYQINITQSKSGQGETLAFPLEKKKLYNYIYR